MERIRIEAFHVIEFRTQNIRGQSDNESSNWVLKLPIIFIQLEAEPTSIELHN